MPRYRIAINVVFPVVVELPADNEEEVREMVQNLRPIRHPQTDSVRLFSMGGVVVSVDEQYNLIEPTGVVEVSGE